ncbi:MAG: hypothetical protein OXQ84_15480 [bacterium]|nr:hypothetical protein [bacterium]
MAATTADDPRLAHHARRHDDTLDEMSLFLLRDQLDAFDAANQRLTRYEDVINASLADHEAQIEPLMPIHGTNRTLVSTILLELGPDTPQGATSPQGQACIPGQAAFGETVRSSNLGCVTQRSRPLPC